ncbi:MAG: YdiU family protein [Chloroflexota bacterium]
MQKTATFDNQFVNRLPADSAPTEFSKRPRQVFGAAYSFVEPTPVSGPQLVAASQEVADLLDFDAEFLNSEDFVNIFSGNRLMEGMHPFAMAYGGHQFGNWAGQLGDGRAINLGELVNANGDHWTLQLKGAGMTPYSRTADGLAVLRSSIREFLCSEAMFHLGVPTTRALSLVTTGESVIRDILYSGNPQPEPGAIVCRVAPSFIRFGNFQLFASRQETELLKQLVDYTIRRDFPHLGEPSQEVYAAWFAEICNRTADMIVNWMRVGFVHGVMNTDNMSILGLTIDYGPYGWLEDYDPNWTPNTTDAGRKRYRFGYQPQIAHWNLAQLGNALIPLFGEENIEPLQAGVDGYATRFTEGWQRMMASKLGLKGYRGEKDSELFTEMQTMLQLTETDMTLFFRRLADLPAGTEISANSIPEPLEIAYYKPEELNPEIVGQICAWIKSYQARVQADGTPDEERRGQMNQVNPKYVLRNYMAQLAIDKAEGGDNALVWELLDLLRNPYDEQPEREEWFAKRPEWARTRVGCSMLSCSS